jgi:hypothetical protein
MYMGSFCSTKSPLPREYKTKQNYFPLYMKHYYRKRLMWGKRMTLVFAVLITH